MYRNHVIRTSPKRSLAGSNTLEITHVFFPYGRGECSLERLTSKFQVTNCAWIFDVGRFEDFSVSYGTSPSHVTLLRNFHIIFRFSRVRKPANECLATSIDWFLYIEHLF